MNEVIKAIAYEILSALQKLFNLIYNSGYFPLNWRKALIIPIFKQNGDFNDPNSYRGIALKRCLARLFNNILNERLISFLNKYNVISEFQIGFKKGSRTAHHMFIFRHLIDLHFKQRQNNIFAAFIDFEKASDTVWRDALLHKLLKTGIHGTMFKIIRSMYSDTYYGVKCSDGHTPFFLSVTGVRQGYNLSSILFNLFLNDITKLFQTLMVLKYV